MALITKQNFMCILVKENLVYSVIMVGLINYVKTRVCSNGNQFPQFQNTTLQTNYVTHWGKTPSLVANATNSQ